MAGGISGNLSSFWKKLYYELNNDNSYENSIDKVMKIFLAGTYSRSWLLDPISEESKKNELDRDNNENQKSEENLKIFLAGGYPNGKKNYIEIIQNYRPYILESFYYADTDIERLIPYFGDFLLDSGAFTFISNKGNSVDWNEYIEKYAEFIKRNKVKKYFELDIDSVVGYEQVKEFRNKLEKLVGYQCIPVWHKNRGIKEYMKHCDEYPYVGVGGYVINELTPNDYKAFPSMIQYAHKKSAKVHCLGFTRLSDLSKYHFDSVDSTAWTTGNRFGYVYYFDGKTMKKRNAPDNHRLADSRMTALHNYTEWIKFQIYADKYF